MYRVRFLISASRDLSIKIHTLNPIEGYIPFNFIGHKNLCTSFFFNNEMSEVIEAILQQKKRI